VEFDEFVAVRGQALVRLAYLLCADFHLAEDLVQNALAKAYPQWSRLASMDHPEAYVRKVVVREHLAWRRKASSRELVTARPVEGDAETESADQSIDVADADWLGRR